MKSVIQIQIMIENHPFDQPENAILSYPPNLARQQRKLESIFRSLENRKAKGNHSYYQVVVDGLTVTPRTDNLEYFWEFKDYLNPDSENLEILCFMGQSYRNTRHHVPLGGPPPQEKLDQEEIDRIVEERVQQWIKEKEFEKTVKERDKLKAKVKKLEKENKELKDEVWELRNTNFDRDNLAVAQVLKQLILVYPQLLEKFPKLKEFHGLFGLEIPEKEESESLPEGKKEESKSEEDQQ